MESFLEAMCYKNENNINKYYNKLEESINLNYSLAYHEMAINYSFTNIDKAIEYIGIAKMLITENDIILAEKIGITLIDDLELYMNSIHI
jgi:hypothetical protein